jgi:xylulose-5-phosphate/fructose-6-phosphate phosphoketolase
VDKKYNALFTTDKPIIFAFYGSAHFINQLTYHRENRNLHVHGYQEEGTITTSFDMRVQNKLDSFNIVKDVVENLPQLGNR